jgi:hypothetical protein
LDIEEQVVEAVLRTGQKWQDAGIKMRVLFVFFFQFYANVIKYAISRVFHQHEKVVKMLRKILFGK